MLIFAIFPLFLVFSLSPPTSGEEHEVWERPKRYTSYYSGGAYISPGDQTYDYKGYRVRNSYPTLYGGSSYTRPQTYSYYNNNGQSYGSMAQSYGMGGYGGYGDRSTTSTTTAPPETTTPSNDRQNQRFRKKKKPMHEPMEEDLSLLMAEEDMDIFAEDLFAEEEDIFSDVDISNELDELRGGRRGGGGHRGGGRLGGGRRGGGRRGPVRIRGPGGRFKPSRRPAGSIGRRPIFIPGMRPGRRPGHGPIRRIKPGRRFRPISRCRGRFCRRPRPIFRQRTTTTEPSTTSEPTTTEPPPEPEPTTTPGPNTFDEEGFDFFFDDFGSTDVEDMDDAAEDVFGEVDGDSLADPLFMDNEEFFDNFEVEETDDLESWADFV